MPQAIDFTTFVSLVEVSEPNVQNIQELASVWGQIKQELDEIGAEVLESFAVLGEVDFIVVFEAEDMDTAFKSDVVLERHGLSVQTMEVTPTEHFAKLVEDS